MTARGEIWVHAGPSLPPPARSEAPALVWRPPAVAGDGLEALEARPRTLVLIDGMFDAYPAIRHKELLALLEAGVTVIGGASMGALRAAEMRTLGMIGVGAIFRAYAAGRWEGDDEVAVFHGPAEMDWVALTVPQVNVRATLAAAVRARVLGAPAARALRTAAHDVFYQDRTWPVVLASAEGLVAAADLQRLAAWLPEGRVDLKRRDAIACVEAALDPSLRRPAPPPPSGLTGFTEALARQVRDGLTRGPASA